MPSNVDAEEDRYTVAGLIRALSSSQPDLEMLVQGDQRRHWDEEYAVACQVAQAMRRDGVGAGDRVAFLDRNGIAYFDFLFGGALIGAVNVAVNWRLSPAEMAAIIDDSGARLLAVHTDYLSALKDMPELPDVRQHRRLRRGSGARPTRAPFASTTGLPIARSRIRATSDAPTR